MRDNAVLVKELRSMMRGRRAFITLTGDLLILSLIAFGVYSTITGGAPVGSSPFYIGVTIFTVLSFFQLMKVSLLTPSFTAGVITREKEQQTFDLLVTTKTSPLAIVTGKLISATAYMFLLILASLPVTSIVFMFGGVSIPDFILAYLIILVTTIFFGSIGIFFSALATKTQFSTILSYASVLLITIGTPITAIFIGVLLLSGPNPSKEIAEPLLRAVLVLNPFYSLGSVFSGTAPGRPFSVSMIVGGPVPGGAQPLPLIPDWSYTLIIYLILTFILLFIASELIKPVNRWQLRSMPLLRRFVKQNASKNQLEEGKE